ncbi:hypothetical protein QBC37DRAFT_384899 [Rhypophila decipiens]|uniref:Uncharacterized protein n=1 Tax=Rhypophila decipiens TaxID=261697 RepID=A0AAN6YDC9_9PEZI|nr:hypothetical protein QBC37DRAFT_384899 [Rhypophila decipiens]
MFIRLPLAGVRNNDKSFWKHKVEKRTSRQISPSSLRVEDSPTPSDSTLSSGHTALVRSAEPESDVLLRHSTTPHCQNSPSTPLLHIVLVLFGRWRLRPGQLHLSPSPSYGHPSLTLHPPQSRGNTHVPMRVMTHCSGPVPPTHRGSQCHRLCRLSRLRGGLNITGASHLIKCDSHWAPGDEVQIDGRIYRIGQRRPVTFWKVRRRPVRRPNPVPEPLRTPIVVVSTDPPGAPRVPLGPQHARSEVYDSSPGDPSGELCLETTGSRRSRPTTFLSLD